jgi:uncharacterized protein (UPF0332 family)
MTDRESLVAFRMKEAGETLSDAEQMLQNGLSPRSITNRAYYAMFYAVLCALCNFCGKKFFPACPG